MSSLVTNRTAMSAVAVLSATQRDIADNQAQLSTGLRIARAKDNAADWSIATSMRTRIGDLKAANDGLAISASTAQVTTAALDTILGLAQDISKDVVSARTSGVDRTALQLDIAQKQQSILDAANNATFSGTNWLVSNYDVDQTTTTVQQYDTTYANQAAILAGRTAGSFSETTTQTSDDAYKLTVSSQILSDTHQVETTGYTATTVARPAPATGNTTSYVSASPTSSTSSSYNPAAFAISIATSVSDDGVQYAQFELPNPIASMGKTTFVNTTTYQYTDTGSTSTTSSSTASSEGYGPALLPGFVAAGSNVATTAANLSVVGASDSDLASMAAVVGQFIDNVASDEVVFGTMQTQIDSATTLNSSLINALTSGVGALVDADMNTVATRQSALQTQQQLGIQSLAIANNNANTILKLFGAG